MKVVKEGWRLIIILWRVTLRVFDYPIPQQMNAFLTVLGTQHSVFRQHLEWISPHLLNNTPL